jgi:hypothetical protein
LDFKPIAELLRLLGAVWLHDLVVLSISANCKVTGVTPSYSPVLAAHEALIFWPYGALELVELIVACQPSGWWAS